MPHDGVLRDPRRNAGPRLCEFSVAGPVAGSFLRIALPPDDERVDDDDVERDNRQRPERVLGVAEEEELTDRIQAREGECAYLTGGCVPQSGESEPGAWVTCFKPVPSSFTV